MKKKKQTQQLNIWGEIEAPKKKQTIIEKFATDKQIPFEIKLMLAYELAYIEKFGHVPEWTIFD